MQINGLPGDEPASPDRGDESGRPRWQALIGLLALILTAECVMLAGATIFLVVELLTATPESYASAIALTVLTAVAAGWLAAIVAGTIRRRPWVRGAAIVWQVLQIALAIGCFQGLLAEPSIGWFLLLPALAALLLLFTPPVVQALRRE